jgi:ABC-type Co2+ transport system permease subunit
VGTIVLSVFSDAGGSLVLASYGDRAISFRPYAVRVASMVCLMYGASFSGMFGLTVNCCTTAG